MKKREKGIPSDHPKRLCWGSGDLHGQKSNGKRAVIGGELSKTEQKKKVGWFQPNELKQVLLQDALFLFVSCQVKKQEERLP